MVVWFIVDLFSQEHLQQEEEYKVARLSVYKNADLSWCDKWIVDYPKIRLIYHDFLPTSPHAHYYITRSMDSLHPNEQVYMHFNIKRVEKVVLRRKKAKMAKTHCFTCFKMRLHLGWSTTIFSQLPHMRTTISPDLWIVYIPMNRSTCILTLKESKKSC